VRERGEEAKSQTSKERKGEEEEEEEARRIVAGTLARNGGA
jgi:hypothetical protein